MFFKKSKIVEIPLDKIKWDETSGKADLWTFSYGTINGYVFKKEENVYKWKIRLKPLKTAYLEGIEDSLDTAKQRVNKILQEITESVIKRMFDD